MRCGCGGELGGLYSESGIWLVGCTGHWMSVVAFSGVRLAREVNGE